MAAVAVADAKTQTVCFEGADCILLTVSDETVLFSNCFISITIVTYFIILLIYKSLQMM